jgi:uncharacterized membrane protein
MPGFSKVVLIHTIIAIALYINKEPYCRYTIAFVLSAFFSIYGYEKRSLSKSGAFAAFIALSSTMGTSYRFGLTMLNFYITSSSLTKYK